MKELLVTALVLAGVTVGTQGALGAGSNNKVQMCIARCVDIGGYNPAQCRRTCEEQAERDGEEDQ